MSELADPSRIPPAAMASVAAAAAPGSVVALAEARAARGRMIDIGGRRLHLVAAGPRQAPTVVLEAGPFGGAADWAVVQARIDGRLRTVAYDRAGLSLSDPGPEPRDSASVVMDLHLLLAQTMERAPLILVAHGLSGVHAHLYAMNHPDIVAGLVLVDAAPPEALSDTRLAGKMRDAQRVAGLAPLAARLGLMRAAEFAGDPIGLPPEAAAEKRQAFTSARHNHWAAVEMRDWERDAAEARAAGELSRELPVASITVAGADSRVRRLQEEPARRSRRGYVEFVEGANAATILGPRFADAIVRGVEHVAQYAQPLSVRPAAA